MTDENVIEFGEPDEIHDEYGTYGFEWQRAGEPMLRIKVADVRNDGDAIYGEFTVWWLLGQDSNVRPIQPSSILKMNSSHSTGWRSIPRELGRRIDNVDWEGAMTVVVDECMSRFRKGKPSTLLGTGTRSTEPPFLLEPWVASSDISLIYGEGGLSKSLIALAMSISVSTGVPIFGKAPLVTGPVMYFDYEDSAQSHEDRVHAICRSFGIPVNEVTVFHHALTAKVTASHQEMSRRAREVGAVMCVLDSVGMGRQGNASAAEDTIRMFTALRTIGIPFLCIDHVSKEGKKDSKAGKTVDPYGTIYTMNQARLAWALSRSIMSGDTNDAFRVQGNNTKHNHVARQRLQNMRIEYRNDDQGVPEFIEIETTTDFGMLMPSVDGSQKLAMYMSHGEWRTYAQVESDMGMKRTTIRSMVSRDKGERYETRGESGHPSEFRDKGVADTLQHPIATPIEDEESE